MDSARLFCLQDRSVEKPVGTSVGNGAASGLQEGMDCMQCACVFACVFVYILFTCLHGGCVTGWWQRSEVPKIRPELIPDSERAVE